MYKCSDYGGSRFLRNVVSYLPNYMLFEEYYLLGYNALWSDENQPTFRRNISPPSSGSENKPNMIAA
jgi:hypothetical protein